MLFIQQTMIFMFIAVFPNKSASFLFLSRFLTIKIKHKIQCLHSIHNMHIYIFFIHFEFMLMVDSKQMPRE